MADLVQHRIVQRLHVAHLDVEGVVLRAEQPHRNRVLS